MIEVAVENLRRPHEWVQQTGTVVQYHAGSEKRALPDGTLFSPELITNRGRGVMETYAETNVPLNVQQRYIIHISMDIDIDDYLRGWGGIRR